MIEKIDDLFSKDFVEVNLTSDEELTFFMHAGFSFPHPKIESVRVSGLNDNNLKKKVILLYEYNKKHYCENSKLDKVNELKTKPFSFMGEAKMKKIYKRVSMARFSRFVLLEEGYWEFYDSKQFFYNRLTKIAYSKIENGIFQYYILKDLL